MTTNGRRRITEAKLGAMAESLREEGHVQLGIELAAFTAAEVATLLTCPDDSADDFDIDAELVARTQPGDLWLLGGHRLLCGDATDAAAVERLMAGEKAGMSFTDPPYNIDHGRHGRYLLPRRKPRTMANDNMRPEAWNAFCYGWARNLLAHVEGTLYVCMSTKEWPLVSRVLADEGGHWSDTIIWAKQHFVLGRVDYHRQYEPIWYGWREGAQHRWYGGRAQGDVWHIDRHMKSTAHPTMKPLALIERALANSSIPGDIVLDLFLGSGSTLIASERTGRVCYGVEIDAHYCDIAVARWEAFTGKRAKKVKG